MISRIIFLLLLGILTYINGYTQSRVLIKDSIDIKTQIEGFYTWYIGSAKANKLNTEFNPTFVRKKNGMSTLDFSNYSSVLKKYKFHITFIKRRIEDYKPCIANLENIPFDKVSKFTDLDNYENIGCDFSNHYEFTGGMEMKDEAKLSHLTQLNKKSIKATIDFFSFNTPNSRAIVYFEKSKSHWMAKRLEVNQ